MQTSLPDLPFTTYADAELKPGALHSSAYSTPRSYPRTNLQTLSPWTSFPNDIHEAIQSAIARALLPVAPFSITYWPKRTFVNSEEKIRAHAMVALHVPVEEVMEIFGVEGSLDNSVGGNSAIIGDPDFSWVTSPAQPHPKLIVEYKTWWVADLADLPAAFDGTRHDTMSRQNLEALQQIYGYMTFNNNKFGILTNWKRAIFLRRSETSDRKTLEYYLLTLDRVGQPISMLKAWVGMVFLAEDDWFYAYPTPSSPPLDRYFITSRNAWKDRKAAIRTAAEHHALPINGQYRCLNIDFRLCRFNLSSACRGANGSVVYGQLLRQSILNRDVDVIFKIVDVTRYSLRGDSLAGEAQAYANLQDLQGHIIPKLYGFYSVWGILQLLALQPVGNSISDDEEIDQALRSKMKNALRCIHNAGFVHGDLARRNFCKMRGGDVFLVDLERCVRSQHQSQLDGEMDEVDRL